MIGKSLKTLLVLCAAMLCAGASAQLPKKVYDIHPVPQQQFAVNGVCDFNHTVYVIAEKGIDDATLKRAKQVLEEAKCEVVFAKKPKSGFAAIYLGVNGSKGVADKLATKRKLNRSLFSNDKFDRHIFSLGSDGKGRASLLILGENTDATFYGLATLEQILDEKGTQSLPLVNIYDYADIKDRGVIEGYYGMPYSKPVTEDLLRFMMRFKMNSYMYGAKSDAYHSQYWDKPYPETLTDEQKSMGCFTAADMKEINQVSAETKVNFIWAIHPGNAFIGKDENVIDRIIGKFSLMHQLGVRQFAVFVDDVGVPTDDPTLELNAKRLTTLQNAMDAKWNQKGANPADTVKPLHFVPQLYAYSWEKPEVRERFYKALSNTPKKTQVYITGAAVWTVPNNKDLEVVEKDFGRDVAWWWNYPCNDNADAWIFPADMYSNFIDMPAIDGKSTLPKSLNHCASLLSNPMQEGEIAKIPLFSVADFAWNNSEFNSRESWQAAIKAVVGDPYWSSLECIIPYLRVNDGDPIDDSKFNIGLERAINEYKTSGNASTVKGPLNVLIEQCNSLERIKNSSKSENRLFYNDIAPWLLKLRQTAVVATHLVDAVANGSGDKAALKAEAEALKTSPEFSVLALEGMAGGIGKQTYNVKIAGKTLTPFIDYLLEKLK